VYTPYIGVFNQLALKCNGLPDWSDGRSRELDATIDLVVQAIEGPDDVGASRRRPVAPILTPRVQAVSLTGSVFS
jgi:hypothetical protein